MGRVVDKSFGKVRKDITKKTINLYHFLTENFVHIKDDTEWSAKQNKAYEKLSALCYGLTEEVDNLDEIDVPPFTRKKINGKR